MTPTPPDGPIRPVVLAGGDSTRFADGDKALARIGGRPMLAHVLGVLAEVFGSRPLVVAQNRERGEALAAAVDEQVGVEPAIATDDPDFDGPVGGLFGACVAVDAPWLFVTGCDMPCLDAGAVSWLCERASSSDAQAVVPGRGTAREPLHALYRRTAVEEARGAVVPDAGLHAVLDALDAVEGVRPRSWPDGFERSLADVDTVDDVAGLRQAASNEETS